MAHISIHLLHISTLEAFRLWRFMEGERMTRSSETLLRFAEGCLAQRDLRAALTAFDGAEAAGASADDCAGGRWMTHMLAGNFAAAWGESDAIRT
jgi:hypothetical protein